jgi:hypothetical protein
MPEPKAAQYRCAAEMLGQLVVYLVNGSPQRGPKDGSRLVVSLEGRPLQPAHHSPGTRRLVRSLYAS